MKIASIIGSTSHVLYIARLNAVESARDTFGSFVSMSVGKNVVIGIVSDSRITDPALFRFSPRSEHDHALDDVGSSLQKDQNMLIAVLLLGTLSDDIGIHEVPRLVIPSGTDLEDLHETEFQKFHRDSAGGLILHYLSNLTSHSGSFGTALSKIIIEKLMPFCSEKERKRLRVIEQSISWKNTFSEANF